MLILNFDLARYFNDLFLYFFPTLLSICFLLFQILYSFFVSSKIVTLNWIISANAIRVNCCRSHISDTFYLSSSFLLLLNVKSSLKRIIALLFSTCASSLSSLSLGVDFINILRAAFTHADPQKGKNTLKSSVFSALWGSACVKCW